MNSKYWDKRLKNHNQALTLLSPLICSLKEIFSVTHFTYFYVNDELETACLSSNPGWLEYYLSEKLYLNNPFLRHPKNIQAGCYFTATIQDKEFRETKTLAKKFDVGESMMLILKEENKTKGFSFGIKPEAYPLLVNELPLIKKFCIEFEKQGGKALKLLSDDPADLKVLFEKVVDHPVNALLNREKKLQFVQKIGISVPQLSAREVECLMFILRGETATSIAKQLNLSVRTIESYLVNVKAKLNCWNKTELFQKAKELYECGLIP